MEQTQSSQQQAATNSAYTASNSLKLRLDTQHLLEQIELNLKGYKEVIRVDAKTGIPQVDRIRIGEPKANDLGIQEILRWLNNVINPAVVQGNYKEERYQDDLYRIRVSLAQDLMTNLDRYGINENDYEGIIDSFMATIRPFLSRLIDNKERESYEATIHSIESNTIKEKGGIRLPFT